MMTTTNMSFCHYFQLGYNVALLNRACIDQLKYSYPYNKNLFEVKHLIFDIRNDIENRVDDYHKLVFNLDVAHKLYVNGVGKGVL